MLCQRLQAIDERYRYADLRYLYVAMAHRVNEPLGSRSRFTLLESLGQSSNTLHRYELVNMAPDLAFDAEKKVFEEGNSDDDVLAQLGYTQGKYNVQFGLGLS